MKYKNLINSTSFIPFLLLILGFLMFTWRIYNVSSMDEYNEVIEALRVGTGHLNFDRWYKRVFLYILALEYGIYFLIGWLWGVFTTTYDFAVKIARDMFPLFLLARLTSALLSLGSGYGIFKIAQKIYSSKVGFITIFLFIFSSLVVEMSHYARVDTCLMFLVVWAMYFIINLLVKEDISNRDISYIAILIGLAIQCKIQGILLFIPFVIAFLFKAKQLKNFKINFWPIVINFILFFIFGLILGNPAILFAFPSFIKSMIGMGKVFTTPINVIPNPSIGYIAYFKSFLSEFGHIGLLISILALIFVPILNRKPAIYVILSLISSYYIVVGASKYLVSFSYMLPIFPFIYLLTSIFIVEVSQLILSNFYLNKIILLSLLLIISVNPVQKTYIILKSFTGPNTRILAKQWIEKNIPPHSKILMDSGKSFNTFAPLIAEDRQSLIRQMELTKNRLNKNKIGDERGIIRPESLILYKLLLETVPNISYDITTTGYGLYIKPLEYYIKNNYQYMIMSKNLSSMYLSDIGRKTRPEIARRYSELKRNLKLIKTISPTPYNRGDTYYIYSFEPMLSKQ